MAAVLNKDLPIIFIVGSPGCGKTTQCNLIAKKYGYTHLRFSFIFGAILSEGTAVWYIEGVSGSTFRAELYFSGFYFWDKLLPIVELSELCVGWYQNLPAVSTEIQTLWGEKPCGTNFILDVKMGLSYGFDHFRSLKYQAPKTLEIPKRGKMLELPKLQKPLKYQTVFTTARDVAPSVRKVVPTIGEFFRGKSLCRCHFL